jgi:hypothetical protein
MKFKILFIQLFIICSISMILLGGCDAFTRYKDIEIPNAEVKKLALFTDFFGPDLSDTYIILTRTNNIGKTIEWDFNRKSILYIDTSRKPYFVRTNFDAQFLFDTVVGAEVKLYINDTLVENVKKDPFGPTGVFKTGLLKPLQPDAVLKIIASAPGYPTIEAVEKAPNSVIPIDVEVTKNLYSSPDNINTILRDVFITINDPPNEKNSYFIFFTRADSTLSERETYGTYLYDANKINNHILTDAAFDGKTQRIRFGVDSSIDDGTYFKGIYVYFRTVNKDYVSFVKTNELIRSAQDNPFVEPFQLTSNIKNGYGYFNIYGQESRIYVPFK